jgi:hypothetical protein
MAGERLADNLMPGPIIFEYQQGAISWIAASIDVARKVIATLP